MCEFSARKTCQAFFHVIFLGVSSYIQSKSGFTGLALVMPALAAKTTIKIIHSAMEVVKVIDLKNWFDNNIGQSVQSQRVMFRDYAAS